MDPRVPAPLGYTQIVNDICVELDAEGALTMSEVNERLCTLAKSDPADKTLLALADASDYFLTGEGEQHPLAFGPYAPMWMVPDGNGSVRASATPLDRVSDEILNLWKDCADSPGMHPLVRSRLADLLWVRSYDGPGRWFQVAIDAYVELATTDAEILDREAGLARAVDICKESGHGHLLPSPLDALSGLVRDALTQGGLFGVVARALQVLVDNGHPCAQLLDDAAAEHGVDPYEANVVLALKKQASQDATEKQTLDRQRVQAFEDAADSSAGILRLSRLEQARAIARDAGLLQEANRLSGLMERTDIEGDLETIEATVEVDPEMVQEFVKDLVGDDSLTGALQRFGREQAVEDPASSREAVAEHSRKSPLLSMITVLRVGDGNTVTKIPSSSPMRADHDLGQYDAESIQMFAHMCGKPVLDALQQQYQPALEAMTRHFEQAGLPGHLARRIALSYQHWTRKDFDSAVSVIGLVLEPAVRSVCSAVGITTTETRAHRGAEASIGGVRALGPLLEDLGARLSPAHARYLVAALVDRHSLNLRNSLAHGLLEELVEAQYIVLFHLACLLGAISEALQ